MYANTVCRLTGAAESLYTSKLCRGRNNNHIVPVRKRRWSPKPRKSTGWKNLWVLISIYCLPTCCANKRGRGPMYQCGRVTVQINPCVNIV